MRQRRVRGDKKGPQATSYPRSTSSSGTNGPVTVQKMPLDANGAMGGIVGHRVRGSEESSYFLDVAGYGEGQGEAHVKAGLSTADTATTPCPRVTKGTKNEKPPPFRSPSRGAGIRSPCGKRRDRAQGAGILLPGGSALQIFIPQAFFANFHGFLSYSRHFPRANDKMVTGFRKLNSFSLPAPSGSSFGDHSDRQGATGSKRWKRWNCRESEVSELVRRDFA